MSSGQGSTVQHPKQGFGCCTVEGKMLRSRTPDVLSTQAIPSQIQAPRQIASTALSTRRVFWIGTALIAFSAFFGTYAYVVVQALIWTQTSLLRGPVVMLFALVLLNLLVRRFARRFALSQSELILLYGMVCMGTCAA